MEDKVIAVPQEEFFQVIDLMDEYSTICHHLVKDNVNSHKPLLIDLCEFYAACERVRERTVKIMQKEVDSRGAKVPENSIVVEDVDYLMLTELLLGISELERILMTQNISLKRH